MEVSESKKKEKSEVCGWRKKKEKGKVLKRAGRPNIFIDSLSW